jgi:hypothetical protein
MIVTFDQQLPAAWKKQRPVKLTGLDYFRDASIAI